MTRYWLPLLISDSGIVGHDDRQESKLYDLTTVILNNSEPIKVACYSFLPLIALFYVNTLRLREVQARNAANIAQQQAVLVGSFAPNPILTGKPTALGSFCCKPVDLRTPRKLREVRAPVLSR